MLQPGCHLLGEWSEPHPQATRDSGYTVGGRRFWIKLAASHPKCHLTTQLFSLWLCPEPWQMLNVCIVGSRGEGGGSGEVMPHSSNEGQAMRDRWKLRDKCHNFLTFRGTILSHVLFSISEGPQGNWAPVIARVTHSLKQLHPSFLFFTLLPSLSQFS